jgi:twinkle protein
MTNAQLLEDKGINLKGKSAGTHKIICPKCSHTRKNKKDTCLSVNIDEGWWKCHHPDCNWSGKVYQGPVKIEKKEYTKPVARLEKLSEPLLKFFEVGRKISNNTLLRFKITEANEWMPQTEKEERAICFNYFRKGELVNIKFRANEKRFKMAKNAQLVFYNIDAIEGEEECVITEGEIDCLSCYEDGIHNAISVPNGASKPNEKGEAQVKLEYLDNCWDDFKNIKKIILMTDDDGPGILLRNELARRLGYERCFQVKYPEGCKDPNDVLKKYGPGSLQKMKTEATEWPMEGILTVLDMLDDVISFYENGYPNGYDVPLPGMKGKFQLMLGQLTCVTGIPGSGKSEFVDWMMVEMARVHNWKWAIFSPENQPTALHVTKLCQKFIGKSFAQRDNIDFRMTPAEVAKSMDFVNDHFFFININEVDISVTGVMDKLRELVLRLGVNGLLIDPWNKLRHNKSKSGNDLDYITDALNQITYGSKVNGVHTILIAHPTKMRKVKVGKVEKYEIPTMYSISGSADFYNMTDNGISVYRDFETGVVDVYRQKIRFNWLGEIGFSSYKFNWQTQQYQILDESADLIPRAPEASNWIPVSSLEPSNEELPF